MSEADTKTCVAEGGAGAGPGPLAASVRLEYADRVNFAMHQAGVALVERLAITNEGAEPMRDVSVAVRLENGECEPWTGRIERIDAGATYGLEPRMALSARRLAERTEAERTAIRVEVVSEGRSGVESAPVELLPFDHWPGAGLYPELLAAFVTPNHPRVAELLGAARAWLAAVGERDSLEGYQSGSRQRAARLAEACFNAALARGIGYINPPASFEREGQRVRLVDRIARENLGSCLDLALLLAGLWEQAGLHALVLLVEGHALAAVWTHEAHLPEPAVDEPAPVRNLFELGEVVPVEATLLAQPGAGFGAAVEAGKRRLGDPGAFFCAVDIRAARQRGVRPLPLRDDGERSAIDADEAGARGPEAAPPSSLDRVALAERAERAGGAPAAAAGAREETGAERIRRWQARLLDLSLRNRLINFRRTGRTIGVAAPDVAAVEDRLADQQSFTLHPRTEGDEAFLRAQAAAGHLYTDEAAAEMQKRLLLLYRTRNAVIDETGANPLYLALGMLRWYETAASETARYAPLILLPVRLERRSAGERYRYELALSEEPLRPNVTLLEKLRLEFGIDTRELEALPEDENGLDVPLILRQFRRAIRETSRWEVEESAVLGLFSFNKFLMWRDLQEHLPRLKRNRLVAHLVDREAGAFDPAPFPRPDRLDEEVAPGELFCTRDADSTQLAAVRAAAEGRTFVLEGPPGTGKSQTIANIIADAVARGKRVLFVAEKMAALGVVRSRLEADGLGPFCLELHSAKASKREVLAQLGAALAAAEAAPPGDLASLCEELSRTRARLNAYVRELHAERGTGESLYRVLGRLTLLGDGPRAALPPGDIAATTSEQLGRWREHLEALGRRAAPIDPPHEHPLRGIGRAEWAFGLEDECRAAIDSAGAALEGLVGAMGAFLRAAGGEAEAEALRRDTFGALVAAARMVREAASSDPPLSPPLALLDGRDAAASAEDLRELVRIGKERDRARARLLETYREEFLSIDHLPHLDAVGRAARRGGPVGWGRGWLARRRLRPYARARVPDVRALLADLETAREVKQQSARLAAATEAAALLGRRWNGGEADWEALGALLDWCERFRAILDEVRRGGGPELARAVAVAASDPDIAARAAEPCGALVEAWEAWERAWGALEALLATSGEAAFGRASEARWPERARGVLERWRGGLAELNDWCNWRRARDAASADGLAGLVEPYESGELALGVVAEAFERAFGEAWFNAVANGVGPIREFNATSHEQAVARFREADLELIERTRAVVAAWLRERARGEGAAEQAEMRVLRRELEKRRRHMPTRRLVEALPNVLPRLKPCFLMSPLSVAQYLDASLPPFDLVVFDEASQIPVWDAIGAIARGSEVIVVGDSRQLPPTTFFNTLDGEEEVEPDEASVEDMESILKECNASGIPAMWLGWHYRSRHESLIAFSNYHYYENRLHTFPSPEERSADLGVTFRFVEDGVYDRGGTRTNRVEAERVVAEVLRLLAESERPDSIGIVTFNQPQQSLIEDLLDGARRRRPEIERFFGAGAAEPVFVKNLENVQGDERDTIIFSVGYGPDEHGRVSMNFGPLNAEGGERRLNVAVTRARRRLVVFSSLRAEQIDLRRTRALGVRHFKAFLEYAERGPRAMAEAMAEVGVGAGGEGEDGFVRAVRRALAERGWEVEARVGCAGYRIDLAVRDPARPGRYLLGIECDGAAYRGAKTARDRDRLRQAVLEALGWRLCRVWSTEWRIHPRRCVERIERALEEARVAAGGGAV